MSVYDNKRRSVLTRELNVLFNKLVNNIEAYYDKELVLNSEGMKLLLRTIKIALLLYPELKPLIVKVRSNPSYEMITKFVNKIKELNDVNSM
ncbi:MAG: hypothetical protein QW775_05855 [Ignisphaera sp.]|uniref:Uncharacterized protein n=1 Tax=Ignisphaera aggregans TaxID=334771 RepID=A0A832CZY6_9CREN